MPLAAKNNLGELTDKYRLLQEETNRLETLACDLGETPADDDRRYILNLEVDALREEAAKLNATIADIVERDLQR